MFSLPREKEHIFYVMYSQTVIIIEGRECKVNRRKEKKKKRWIGASILWACLALVSYLKRSLPAAAAAVVVAAGNWRKENVQKSDDVSDVIAL